MRQFWAYIVASRTGTLYVGMTNDLKRPIYEHKHKLVPGFTAKYGCDQLVFYESFPTAAQAIVAEKRIKGWTRAKKVALVKSMNPTWADLNEEDGTALQCEATLRCAQGDRAVPATAPATTGNAS